MPDPLKLVFLDGHLYVKYIHIKPRKCGVLSFKWKCVIFQLQKWRQDFKLTLSLFQDNTWLLYL